MTDADIIALYFDRSQEALAATRAKYGGYLYGTAFRLLAQHEDAEECVNDTYLKTWEAIPPARPKFFQAFLAKITRRLALDRYRYHHRHKRGRGQVDLALEELEGVLASGQGPEEALDEAYLLDLIHTFLAGQDAKKQEIFLRRYFFLFSSKEIARDMGMKEAAVNTALFRLRENLKEALKEGGIVL